MPDRVLVEEAQLVASRGRILVVDDEEDIRESLEALLTLENYQVDMAASAAEGLARMDAATTTWCCWT